MVTCQPNIKGQPDKDDAIVVFAFGFSVFVDSCILHYSIGLVFLKGLDHEIHEQMVFKYSAAFIKRNINVKVFACSFEST